MAKAKKPEDDTPAKKADEKTSSELPETSANLPSETAAQDQEKDVILKEETHSTSQEDTIEPAMSDDLPEENTNPWDRPADGAVTEQTDADGADRDVAVETEETPEEKTTETEPVEEKNIPAPVQQSGSIWPAVFGGIIAALLGFIAGRGDQLDYYLPASMQRQTADLAPLVDQTTALSERIEALETAAPPDQSQLASNEALDSAVAEIDTLNASLSALAERLEEVEARPVQTIETVIEQPVETADNSEAVASNSEAVSSNSDEISALQAMVETLQQQISADEARAASEAERILAQAALTRVITAVDNGETFEPALGALEEVTPVEVPDALRAVAAEGVPSMAALRESFPEAARAGLAAARAEVPETEVSGIGGFLRRQLSARSVTPREGSDPDAVLSRVEAAMKTGNLEEALSEVEALPEAAKSAMQGWLDAATARQSARAAAQGLSDSLTVN